MANPQLEDGYFRFATIFADKLAAVKMRAVCWQCFWVVIRKTYAWHKKWDKISYSQFAKSTDINEKQVSSALKELKSRKIILTSKQGVGRTVSYCFNKNYEEWIDPPLNRPPPKQAKNPPLNRGKPPPKQGDTIDTLQKIIQKIGDPHLLKFEKWVLENNQKIQEMAKVGGYKISWVQDEFKKMRVYILGNPQKAPKKYIGKFISGWLQRGRKWQLEPKNPITAAQEQAHYDGQRRAGANTDFCKASNALGGKDDTND